MNLTFLAINIFLCLLSKSYAYQTRALTQLCPPDNSLKKSFSTLFRTMQEVKLGEMDESAALIQFSWNSSNFKRYEDCKFRVIATIIDDKQRNRGVFVSIRRLNLRKSPISEDCVDFIRFTFGKTKSPKYCGQLNASVDDVKKIYFGEGGGVIDVQIRLDTFQPLRREFDTLDVELVFTANEDCGPPNLINCFDNTCISEKLKNDGINNCPPPFCSDEGGICPKPPIVVAKEATANNTDIVISALTSLIFTLVGVGSCLWLCWHIKDCFLPEQDTQSRSMDNRRSNTRSTAFNSGNTSGGGGNGGSGGGETYTSATGSNSGSRATAPSIDDKDDNPPSYDQLFPQLANSNNENK